MTQSIDYRYFDGEPCMLCFGDGRKPLYVQEGILSRIPFFEAALRFTHGTQDTTSDSPLKRTIDLPDCNSKAVADVMHYSMVNNIPPIQNHTGEGVEGDDKRNDNDVRLYSQAWIVADRFNLERVANDLIDRIVEYSENWLLNPSLVKILVEAGHSDSKLCNFMVRDIAYQIREQSYVGDENDWSFHTAEVEDSSSLQYESFEAVCQNMPSSILARIIRETQAAKECPTQAAIWNPCMLHTHKLTDPCSPPAPDNSDEDADERSD